MCSRLLFFRCRSFLPWWPLADFSFSHRRYKIFMFFFQRNRSPLFFFSRFSSFSVQIRVNVDVKIKSKERIGFVFIYHTKSLGGYANSPIYRRNGQALKMQNYTPAYMKGWTYVRRRTDDFLRTKIS